MTAHTDEIYQLIVDIDNLLSYSPKGLSKFLSNQGQQEKEVLQRVRDFLVRLQEDEVSKNQVLKDDILPKITDSDSKPAFSSLLAQFNQQSQPVSALDSSSQQLDLTGIETVPIKQELTVLLQPLKTELSSLLAERADLTEEIKQLEQKRLQNHSLSQQLANREKMISEFLEVLMSRLVPHLISNSGSIINPNLHNLEAISSAIQPILESAERVEQLANLAYNLDQRLLSLDGTVNIVFQALERNINTYYQSLSQALDKMHGQGMQGEQLMANFLNNLTRYLQQQVLINEPSISHVNTQAISVSPLLDQSLPIEDLKPSEDIFIETSAAEILPINLDTVLLDEQSQSAKDLGLKNADDVDELYASFFDTATYQSLNFSFSADILHEENQGLSNDSTVVNDDLSTVEISSSSVSMIADSTILSEEENYDLPVIVSDVSTEFEVTFLPDKGEVEHQKEVNPADTIVVLTDLLLDTSYEERSSEVLNQWDDSRRQPENHDLALDTQQSPVLGQNLADFDQPLNYGGESITKLDSESQEVDLSLTTQKYIEVEKIDSSWYLGIDIGTTGISAALLNHSKLVVYPIYWSAETQNGSPAFQQSFRLPAEVYLPTNPSSHHSKNGESESAPHLYSAQLKPYLQIAVPYQPERQKWEPMLQLNEFSAGPLIWVLRSLSKLLSTLRSSQTSTTPALIANAVGMNTPTFSRVIKNITGVICTCPSNWTEQYRFNIREAIVTSELVSHPQQILFLEEAIASLLPELDSANGQSIQISENQGLRPLKTSNYPLLGNTLAINIGATLVEMALVDIPANLGELTHKDFMLHNFAYSGKGIEQDIICQLLLPPKSRQTRQPGQSDHEAANTNPWHWQPSIPGLDQMQFSSLGLEALTLPKVGEPDTEARIHLQQRLESSLLGQALLDAALALKLILQHQETFTLEFADQRWVLQRRDLESQVFVPFVRRLNRELNKLLVARGIPTEAINQAVLSGGVASVGTINRWLRQKLPNAKIIQDLYLSETGAPNCSRVALGLSVLSLHPQFLDISKQQYTDYFLFSELLKLLPNRSLSFGEVLQLFESRGINTRTCQQRLLAFLEGELPPGLIPAASDHLWLTHQSQENPDYKAISSLKSGIDSPPLFEKQGNLSYRPNAQQVQLLLHYLDAIKSSNVQSFDEPYSYIL